MTLERESPTDLIPAWEGRPSLSLKTNLRALSEDLPTRQGRVAAEQLADRLDQETPLDVAVSELKPSFPRDMQTWIEVGVDHSQLDTLLVMYLSHVRRQSELRRGLWLALAYPLCLMLLSIFLMVAILTMLIPKYGNIYEDFGIQLPLMTQMVVSLSRVLSEFSGFIILISCLFGLLMIVGLSIPASRRIFQGPFRAIPVFGSVFRLASISQISNLLAMLVSLEVPLPRALRSVSRMTDDHLLASDLRHAADQIESGGPSLALSEFTHSMMALPLGLAGALLVPQSSGQLRRQLRAHAEIYATHSRIQLNLIRWIIEPVILLLIAITIGAIFVTTLLPLVKLLNDLS